MKVALIGLGNRGRIYTHNFYNNPSAEVVAVCDKNTDVLAAVAAKAGLSPDAAYSSEDEFFAAGKLADALVIATQDRDHYRHAMKAMELGYNLLLEKPVSPVPEEVIKIAETAAAKNLKVVVCHVLRYSAYYDAVKKIIDSGLIGKIQSVNNTENVGYWHFSHSYVRGNWRREDETAPSLLAKCCHDLDFIYYFTGKKCLKVFSTASRAEFVRENAPDNSTDYCLAPCPAGKECPYHVAKLYYKFTRHTIPKLIVHAKVVTKKGKFSLKELKNSLKTSPYGRCVYKCDNDVMENQIVAMEMEDGVKATHTMTAFTKDCYRKIHISGTKGEILGNDKDGFFRLNVFGKGSKKIKVNGHGLVGHLGGDAMIVKDFIDYVDKGVASKRLTLISETLESHRVAFAAEESRKSGEAVSL